MFASMYPYLFDNEESLSLISASISPSPLKGFNWASRFHFPGPVSDPLPLWLPREAPGDPEANT